MLYKIKSPFGNMTKILPKEKANVYIRLGWILLERVEEAMNPQKPFVHDFGSFAPMTFTGGGSLAIPPQNIEDEGLKTLDWVIEPTVPVTETAKKKRTRKPKE